MKKTIIPLKPIPHAITNLNLIPPGEWENVHDLPAHKTKDGEIVTRWRLTWRDIWNVIRDREIFVSHLTVPPPMMVCTEDPVEISLTDWLENAVQVAANDPMNFESVPGAKIDGASLGLHLHTSDPTGDANVAT